MYLITVMVTQRCNLYMMCAISGCNVSVSVSSVACVNFVVFVVTLT